MDICYESFALNKFFTHELCTCIERRIRYIICLKCFCTLVRNNDLLIPLLKTKTIVYVGKSQVLRRKKKKKKTVIINDIFGNKMIRFTFFNGNSGIDGTGTFCSD